MCKRACAVALCYEKHKSQLHKLFNMCYPCFQWLGICIYIIILMIQYYSYILLIVSIHEA